MATSKIEWLSNPDGSKGKVWNPVTGCTKVSQGCAHCYAEGIAKRFWHKQYSPTVGGMPRPFSDVRLHHERLDEPRRWKKPQNIFVDSMNDLFHKDVPFSFIKHVFEVTGDTPQHTYMILTKRAERMLEFSRWMAGADDISIAAWPRNVRIGVSVENQQAADERIPLLLQTPAACRFLSVEPMLGPVCLHLDMVKNEARQVCCHACGGVGVPVFGLPNWVICGGESGSEARPMRPDWARSLRDQCQAADIPFFFKQWGEWSPERPLNYCKMTSKRYSHEMFSWAKDGSVYNPLNPPPDHFPSTNVYRAGKRVAGCLLDGREWKEFPEERGQER